MHSFNSKIWVLVECLKYEPAPDQVKEIPRASLHRRKAEHRGRFIISRISPQRAEREQERINRAAWKDRYSKAIQEKYNVGPGWEQNRYFVEQVRPTP